MRSLVDKVIQQSDIILIVVDARRLKESMDPELEKDVKAAKKKYLYVINKVDLVDKPPKLKQSIAVSAREHLSTMKLLKKIMMLARGEEATVGVIGYPNTGKSTLINALKGKHSARTSSISGYTKAIQMVRISKKLIILDTPGVIPYQNQEERIIVGAMDATKIRDPELAAMKLIEALEGKVEKYFGVKIREDKQETLEEIAVKKKIVKKLN